MQNDALAQSITPSSPAKTTLQGRSTQHPQKPTKGNPLARTIAPGLPFPPTPAQISSAEKGVINDLFFSLPTS